MTNDTNSTEIVINSLMRWFKFACAAVVIAVCIALYFQLSGNTKQPIKTEPIGVVPDSVIAKQDRGLRYGKQMGTVGPVIIYKMVTIDGENLYIVISNAPGVTGSVTVVKKDDER